MLSYNSSNKTKYLKKEKSMSCDFVDITIDSDGIHIDIEW